MDKFIKNKKILYAGRTEAVSFEDGCKLFFNYQAKTLPPDEPKVIDDSRKPFPDGYGQKVELVLGHKFKIPAWETCLKTMRIGEVSSFILDPADLREFPFVSKQFRDISGKHSGKLDDSNHHHNHRCAAAMHSGMGYKELDELVKNPQPLEFTFELFDVKRPGIYLSLFLCNCQQIKICHLFIFLNLDEFEPDSFLMDTNAKLQSIPSLKEKGNEFLKSGNTLDAEKTYLEALSRLESVMVMERPGSDEFSQLDLQKVPLFLNLAQCKLLQKNYYESINFASEALKLDPNCEKAFFRRAKAHMGASNFTEAKDDWATLGRLNSSFKSLIQQQMEEIARMEKSSADQQRNQFKGLFS